MLSRLALAVRTDPGLMGRWYGLAIFLPKCHTCAVLQGQISPSVLLLGPNQTYETSEQN